MLISLNKLNVKMHWHTAVICGLLFFSKGFSNPVFLEEPEAFSPAIEVAGCACFCDHKILLLRRNFNKPQGGTWCVPGGKLEEGETPHEAVVREIEEETGINFEGEAPFYCGKVFVRFPEVDFILHLFLFEFKEEPTLHLALEEHEEYRWVSSEEAKRLPLIPGGDQCLQIVEQKREK